MLIVCPSCASEYQIALDRVGPEGRSVRCAACRETWFIPPDAVSAALEAEMSAAMLAASEAGPGAAEGRASAQADLEAWEAAVAAEPEPSPGNAPGDAPVPVRIGPRPRGKRPGKAKAKATKRASGPATPAAALALALVAVIGSAILARATVVALMPQSAGFYARIGLPVNLRGLDLRDVVAFQTPGEGAQGQLVVEGNLVGVAAAGAEVPAVEVEVRDAQDLALYRWRIAPPRPALEKGETARFRASLSAPPAQGRSVRVRFARAGQGAEAEVTAEGAGKAEMVGKAEMAGRDRAGASRP